VTSPIRRSGNQSFWTEPDITDRTAELIDRMTTIWTRPPPAMTQPDALAPEEPAETTDAPGDGNVSAHVGKYHALHDWLRQQSQHERRLGRRRARLATPGVGEDALPHWYGYDRTAVGPAIRDARWKATGVDLAEERVVFARDR